MIEIKPVPYVCQVCLRPGKWIRDSFYTGKEYFCHEHYVNELQFEYENIPRGHDHADYYHHKWVEIL